MDDCEYVFRQDVKEKKNIGRNSKYMNRTGKGPLKFPSDYLTKKEKKALNGPCMTYDMGKPITYRTLKSMPNDLQKTYLQGLIDKFHPSTERIGELFGVSSATIKYRFEKLGVKPAGECRGGKIKSFDISAWNAWIMNGAIPEELVEEEPAEQHTMIKEIRAEVPKPVMPDVIINENEGKDPNFTMIADLWNAYLGASRLTSKDAAAMLALSKFAFISTCGSDMHNWEALSNYIKFVIDTKGE